MVRLCVGGNGGQDQIHAGEIAVIKNTRAEISSHRWQRKSGLLSIATSGIIAPDPAIAAVKAYSALILAMPLTASRCTSTDLLRMMNFKCCSKPFDNDSKAGAKRKSVGSKDVTET